MSVLHGVIARLGKGPGRVVLNRQRSGGGAGPWSYAASQPEQILRVRGKRVEIVDGTGMVVSTECQSPLHFLVRAIREFSKKLESPVRRPVALGYLGYDLGSLIVPRVPPPPLPGLFPDAWFGLYPGVWRWSEGSEPSWIGEGQPPEAALPGAPPELCELAASAEEDERYCAGIRKSLEYIAAGDIYQVNLSRPLRAGVAKKGDGLALFANVSQRESAPFSAVIDIEAGAILSLSPEHFLGFDARTRRLETRPIKGTRARTLAAHFDQKLAEELAHSPKDLAEHLMIVDLERSDLGRIAVLGSVAVDSYAALLSLSRVHHLVSTVSCTVRQKIGLDKILGALFPGGSITGAPKIRAMQIIHELESKARGVYTGAIGYIASDGSAELSLAIRTATLSAESLELRVGGGVVFDSSVEREFAETEEKAAGWRFALAG